MTKLRAPNSTEDAMRQAIGLLGSPNVAAVVGRSEQLVNAWSDPDDGRGISLDAASAIDRALQADGYPPIFADLLRSRCTPPPMTDSAVAPYEELPIRAAVRVVGEASAILKQVADADRDGVIDACEQQRLDEGLTRLMREAGATRRAIRQRPRLALVVLQPGEAEGTAGLPGPKVVTAKSWRITKVGRRRR